MHMASFPLSNTLVLRDKRSRTNMQITLTHAYRVQAAVGPECSTQLHMTNISVTTSDWYFTLECVRRQESQTKVYFMVVQSSSARLSYSSSSAASMYRCLMSFHWRCTRY